ncbi:phosphatidylglycerophosphatase A family protein [Elioraea rosea]|uniref:phosphatidylglycerophosphatase A family protein n=1 Tax=Elioraea rosea TaxID=2492390 RepID=UPI0011832D66|nr:phosphatidylglycerophosphatase A [Elioraea rosea]
MTGLAALWGVGRLPYGPGTWASLVALAPGAMLLALGGPLLVAAAALALCWLGWRAVSVLPDEAQQADAGWIVVDEAAGQWLALAGLGAVSLAGILFAFLLFRLFDIAKPWPVSWADRQVGATGIMLDDMLAGALAALALILLRLLAPEVLP